MNKITLIIPDLENVKDLKLFRHAQAQRVVHGTNRLLGDLFQIEEDLAIAPLSAFADGLEPKAEQFWMRADPMSVAVDLVHIYLVGNEHHQLQQNELEDFYHLLNDYFSEFGIRLHIPTATRWYLEINKDPQIVTNPVSTVLGKAFADYLPKGAKRMYWLKIITEVQMLLHTAQINVKRKSQQSATVDTLWLWGEGKLPRIRSSSCWQRVISDDSVVIGLAKLNQINHCSLEVGISGLLQQGKSDENILLYCAVKDLPDNFFTLLLKLIKSKKKGQIQLYCGDGYCYSVQAKTKKWFFSRA